MTYVQALQITLIPLTLSNSPSNVAAFTANGWGDALDKIEQALENQQKHSAVWFMGDRSDDAYLETVRQKFFDDFFRSASFDKNYKRKECELYHDSKSETIRHLSDDARAAFRAIAARGGLTDVIQRYQISTPPETSIPHFESPVSHIFDRARKDHRFLNGRNIRLIFTEKGDDGPIIFGSARAKLNIIDEGGLTRISKGMIENRSDLGQAYSVPGRTLIAITGQEDWGSQALAHCSPSFSATPSDFRAQTIFDLKF